MTTANALHRLHRQTFSSVFKPEPYTTPTPDVSPYTGGPLSPTIQHGHRVESASDDIARRPLAWSAVTRWLTIPVSEPHHRRDGVPRNIEQALATVLASPEGSEQLLGWVRNDIKNYHDRHVAPTLRELWKTQVKISEARLVVQRTVQVLDAAQTFELHSIKTYLATSDGHSRSALAIIRDKALVQAQSLALRCLPDQRLFSTLALVLHDQLASSCVPSYGSWWDIGEASDLLVGLRVVGLGQDYGERALAYAVNAVINTYFHGPEAKVRWINPSSVVDLVRSWVTHQLEPAIRTSLQSLTGNPTLDTLPSEIEQWQRLALERLGRYRVKYLFDYVKAWDHSKGALLDLKEFIHTPEAKNYLATKFTAQLSQRLLHAGAQTAELLSIYVNIIYAFKALDPRGVLLEKVAVPLRAYLRERDDTVKVIAASFLADLDESGNSVNPSDDICHDIAREVAQAENQHVHVDAKGLDWNDMSWLPDPIDAGPDFRMSKNEDIVSYMLTLLEQDDFIKEVQTILGERLLVSEDSELEKEIRLVELFKSRFGQDKLQTCEVMLRDVQDSNRLNKQLRSNQHVLLTLQEVHQAIPEDGISLNELTRVFQPRVLSTAAREHFLNIVKETSYRDRASGLLYRQSDKSIPTQEPSPPTFYAQILSSFFWPALRDDDFTMPAEIVALQATYERDFERIKKLRKLHWLPALGRATVELELHDRTVRIDNVHTWQASVIHAFQDASESDPDAMAEHDSAAPPPPPVSKTVQQLATALAMDELLVRNAVAFWAARRVLVETAPDTYVVLETLSDDALDASTGLAAAAAAAPPLHDEALSAVKSQNAVLHDNKDMYEMFMVGMLTNGGAMDAARIAMMLKLVVPGGFAFGEEEVLWLLGGLEEQGRVVRSGATFSVRK